MLTLNSHYAVSLIDLPPRFPLGDKLGLSCWTSGRESYNTLLDNITRLLL